MGSPDKPPASMKRVLIVEDDRDLGPRLQSDLAEFDHIETSLKACVHGDALGGLDELLRSGAAYDLIVVDIMLPNDEAMLAKRRATEEELDRLSDRVMALPDTGIRAREEGKLRALMERLFSQARALVEPLGGIEMLEEWKGQLTHAPHKIRPTRLPAIMYLSSRHERAVQERAETLAVELNCRCAYLTKPQSIDVLTTTIANLLRDKA